MADSWLSGTPPSRLPRECWQPELDRSRQAPVISFQSMTTHWVGGVRVGVEPCTNAGYHQQAGVENACIRDEAILGAGLRASSRGGRRVDASLAWDALDRMIELCRPESSAIRR